MLAGLSRVRAVIPFMKVPPHDGCFSQRPLLPNIITLGIEISIYEFGVDTNIQVIVLANTHVGWCALNVVYLQSDWNCYQI